MLTGSFSLIFWFMYFCLCLVTRSVLLPVCFRVRVRVRSRLTSGRSRLCSWSCWWTAGNNFLSTETAGTHPLWFLATRAERRTPGRRTSPGRSPGQTQQTVWDTWQFDRRWFSTITACRPDLTLCTCVTLDLKSSSERSFWKQKHSKTERFTIWKFRNLWAIKQQNVFRQRDFQKWCNTDLYRRFFKLHPSLQRLV